MADIKELEALAAQVRRDIVRMVYYANSGHPGGSLGAADFMTALYFKVMDIHPEFTMEGINEDIFVLSNGHISPLLYSVLARKGYFSLEELSTFRKIDSRLQGHPTTHEGLPGIRISTGSLGQGLGVATGMALGKKMNGDPTFVFALTGDGELQEGSIWEALMFAPAHHLDNLIVTVDWNGQQIDGPTDKVLSLGDLEAKFTSFGWSVVQTDGNDMREIVKTLVEVKNRKEIGVPTAILMRTVMGQGVSYMEGHHEWHGKAPNKAQFELAMSELPETLGDYPYNENFKVEFKKH